MRAVVTVTGKDKTGIIATVSKFLADRQINVLDINQTILQNYFAMVMLVDITDATVPLSQLSEESANLGKENGLIIHVQHEDIFNAMHKV